MITRQKSLKRISQYQAFIYLMNKERYKDIYFYNTLDQTYLPAQKYKWAFYHDDKPHGQLGFEKTQFYLEVEDESI